MNTVNPYSCISYRTKEVPQRVDYNSDMVEKPVKKHVILKDSSCQADEKFEEVPIQRQEKGVNLVISQPYGVDGLDPLTKLPINNIYYSMYDPRVLRPKKLRKRSNVENKKKSDKKGVDLNLEDDEKYEKSFYANLMKKRTVGNDLIKSSDNNKAKKGSLKPDITYPYKPVEEINKISARPNILESEVSKQVIIEEKPKVTESIVKQPESLFVPKPATNEGLFKNVETKPVVSDGLLKLPETKPVVSETLFKQPEVKPVEQKPVESKPLSFELFKSNQIEEKKPETTQPTKQVESKPLFGNASNTLFEKKPDLTTSIEQETQKPVIAPLFPNQGQNSLFNFAKKPEEEKKDEQKPAGGLFLNNNTTEQKGLFDNKPLLLTDQNKIGEVKTQPETAKPTLFGLQSGGGGLFNTQKQDNDSNKLFGENKPAQKEEIKPFGGNLFTQPLDSKPTLLEQSKSGGFNLNTGDSGLFSKLTGMPQTSLFNNNKEPTTDLALKTISEEKSNPFEEEQSEKQQPVVPTNQFHFGAQNTMKSSFMSPTPSIPPNENPLANQTQNPFSSNNNTSVGGLFGQNPSNLNVTNPISTSPFSLPTHQQPLPFNALTSPKNDNPFIASCGSKQDNKSPTNFGANKQPSMINKSGGSNKGDVMMQRINDVKTPGGVGFPQTGTTVGTNLGNPFVTNQTPLFGANPQGTGGLFVGQPNPSGGFSLNQNGGTGLFGGQSLFNNSNGK